MHPNSLAAYALCNIEVDSEITISRMSKQTFNLHLKADPEKLTPELLAGINAILILKISFSSEKNNAAVSSYVMVLRGYQGMSR